MDFAPPSISCARGGLDLALDRRIGRNLHVLLTKEILEHLIVDKFSSMSSAMARSMVLALLLAVPFRGSTQIFLLEEGTVLTTCSGELCEPSGPDADYANDQHIVASLCPTGGPDAGPLTSILFTQWELAPGPGDHLNIYQGTEADGPPFVIGSQAEPLLGQTVISTHPSGCLTFDWETDEADSAAGWKASITTGPDAGADGLALLEDGPLPFNLLDSLEGTPDPTGSWTAPDGSPCDGLFDPDTEPLGTYTYTVEGPAPCPAAIAVLLLQRASSVDAGTNGTLVLCTTSGVADLFTALGGTPDPGGTWTAPGGASHGSTFDPLVDPPGAYIYTVACTPQPCVDPTATVTVTVNAPPSAGSNGSVSVCSTGASVDLFTQLGGSPNPGGAWTAPGGAPVSSIFLPGTSAPGTYTYTVLGAPPCANASATVTVSVVNASNAGTSRSITVCSNAASFALIGQLGGTPQAVGTWTGPSGPQGPTFDPATGVAGAYVYSVPGTAPCSTATATLTIAIQQAPNAGINGSATVCSTDANFALTGRLGGTPDGGGSWTAPGGAAFPGTFIPGASAPGIYTYTVPGVPPCANANSTVTVSVNTAPNAGVNSTLSRCSNTAAFNLFAQLGGTPAPDGTWVGPAGASNGTFTPGTSTPGAYTYTVLGIAPCANATAVVTVAVVQAPNAGTLASTTVCANGASVELFSFLGGTPDAVGTWTAPGGGAFSGTFVPGTSVAGTYTFTVAGTAPCLNAQATVAVTVVTPPNAGTSGAITVCSNGSAVNLFLQLGGSPALGGTWTKPDGTSHSGSFQPATDPVGTYTYAVVGIAPCSAATATVQVSRVTAPNAGVNGAITVCSTTAPFQLFTILGGTPSGGGAWLTPTNAAFNGTFTPGTTPAGMYKYVVLGTGPCANDTGFVAVVVNQAPNAGTNASSTVCSGQAAFNLFTQLGGTPNGGGTWTGPTGLSFPGIYTPGSSLAGGYTYTVVGLTPCLNASAVVAITEQRQPVAGTNASFSSCSTDGPVDLWDALGGTPDGGGTWTAPGGGANSGVFLPASSAPGVYTYTVTGNAPCTNAVATVTATVNQAPDAGTSTTISICADAGTVNLFNALGGTPDAGGVWTDDDGTGQLSGQLFSPAGLPAGNYDLTYTVTGNGLCGDDQATVRVTIVAALDAGLNGTLSVCGSNNLVNLFSGLGGTPQPGGSWVDLSGTGALTGQFFNATLVPAGNYVFRYELSGSASCASDFAEVTVTVVAQRRPGNNGATTVCSTSAAFNLFPLLGGNPQTGGVWTVGVNVVPSEYDPVTNNPAVFTYTLIGTAPCPNATATVTVSEVIASNAGTSAVVTKCSNDGTFNMTLSLGGTPQPGTWSFGGVPNSNLFTPGVDLPGVHLYTVPGQSPCGSAFASLTVNVNTAPNAGANATRTVCGNGPSFSLFSALTGGAQAGGTWTGPGPITPHGDTYNPVTDAPGDYFYTLTGTPPCAPDVAVVTVFENAPANAGTSSSLPLCSGGAPVGLITALGGTPDPAGIWTGPAPSTASFNGNFIPGTTTPGTYTYTVIGTPPCPNATATVSVSVTLRPSSGTSRSITVCSNDAPFGLTDSLGGTPAFSGIWTTPLGDTISGVFTPETSPPGVYTYTVPATAPCANAVSTITITVNARANAGADASISACSNGGAIPLFPLLGPNAQAGGSWVNQGTGLAHSGTFVPSVDATGVFVYTVQGPQGCDNDQALVSVTLNQAPNAGFNGLVTVCDRDDSFQLVNELNGAPQLNGSWLDPTGDLHSGIYEPEANDPGVYTYTVNGTLPCSNAQAQVTVIENERPDAGDNGVVSVCSSDPAFSLFDELSGTFDLGGSWTRAGVNVGSEFTPGTSLPGVYKYRIQGVAPCASDSATVTVIVSNASNAGVNSVRQICSSSGQVSLISLLGGTPGPGGTWLFGGVEHGPLFDPAVDESGAYVHTIAGTAPCANAVAQVQVTLVAAPNAGTNGSIAACLGDPAIALADGLGGAPNGGGLWEDTDNTGQLNGGLLNATSLAPGSYDFRYIVAGVGPCDTVSAIVTVVIAADLNAGDDRTLSACANELVDLFAELGGTPQPGGSWTDVDISGALIGGVFDPSQVGEGTTWRFAYILPGASTCQSDTATVTVTSQPGPFAGCDGFAGFCLSDPPDNLIGSLSCDPDAEGTWFTSVGAPFLGTFVPATDAAGLYLYVVPAIGNCAADTAVVEVQVRTPVDAGQNASAAICNTDSPVPLFTFLGPTAQAGGVWSVNNVVVSGTYTPSVDGPGIYQYRVTGLAPCPADFAFVTVTEPQAPEAGSSASIAVCSNNASFSMRDRLGGLPQQGGAWTAPDTQVHPQEYNPAEDDEGTYTYVIIGITPCANDTAELTIALTQAPDAGSDSIVSACVTQTEVDVFAALGAGAQPGGTWTDLDISGALTGNVFDPSAAGNGSWDLQYAILASSPCSNAFSIITVNVGTGSSAGGDSTLTICGAASTYALINALAGDPDEGGVWTDLVGTGALQSNGILDATLLPTGGQTAFVYTVEDAGCGNVQATVLISTVDFPDPGIGSSIVLCATDSPIDLIPRLGGTPGLTGVWTGPLGAPNGGTFNPAVDPPGPYSYTVAGDAFCADSVSVLQITINAQPDAGTNGQVVLCDTVLAFPLITGLAGTPDLSGTWTDLDASGALSEATINTTGLDPDGYSYRYTVQVAGCASASATVEVDVVTTPRAVDLSTVCNEQDRTYVVTFTIEQGVASSYEVVGAPGVLSTTAPFTFVSEPILVSEPFFAVLRDANACGEFQVEASSPCAFDTEVFVPQSFSPNGDGINETFQIPGIEGFPNNTIRIYNRWGSEMFNGAGYDNSSVVWDGSSPDALLPGSAPSGTYFYVLELGNSSEPVTGFVQLVR